MDKSEFPVWRPGWTIRRILEEGILSKMMPGRESDFYKALRNSSSGFINRADVREYIFKRDDYKCKICGAEDNLTIDHVNSVANCSLGKYAVKLLNTEENLQTLCGGCNCSKKH